MPALFGRICFKMNLIKEHTGGKRVEYQHVHPQRHKTLLYILHCTASGIAAIVLSKMLYSHRSNGDILYSWPSRSLV